MSSSFKPNASGIICGAALAVLIAVAVIYGIIITGVINPSADDATPPLERWAAKTSLHAYLKNNTPKTTNPLKASSEDDLMAGAGLYVRNCAFCHGFANGTTSKTANGLYRRPPIIVKDDLSEDPDGQVYWFIDRGVKLTGMPSYNKTLKEKEIWQLVLFIKNMKTLPPNVQKYWENASAHPLIDQ